MSGLRGQRYVDKKVQLMTDPSAGRCVKMAYTGSVVQRRLPVQLGQSKHLPMVLQWQWYIMEEVNLENTKPGHMYGHDGTVPEVASTGASGKKVVSYVKPPSPVSANLA